jgi:CDP-diacylglycerol--glycerol-3-phosphate 3-phosphatidyltransferase
MSASQPHLGSPRPRGLSRGEALMPRWVKDGARAALAPVVRGALALHVTPNTVTVIGFAIVVVAAVLVWQGYLLAGAAVLTAGSLLDAVDGALARARGGGTDFGSFLDSTLDRAAEAVLYIGVAGYFLRTSGEPTWPVLAAFAALAGSFLVSYSHARAQGLGLSASVGLAPRTERLVLVIAGIGLAGLGYEPALIGALVLIGALAVATVIQRIWHVWRLAESRRIGTSKENHEG